MFPSRRGTFPGPLLAFVLTLTALASTATEPMRGNQDPAQAVQAPAIPIEVVVLDRSGTVADALTADSFAVTVDGRPRQVRWVRYVSRGPGASDEAARRLPGGTETLRFAAEPSRNVLLVIDESTIQRGAERTVTQAAAALVDRLGLDDRIGVIRIPMARETRVELTTLRPEVREALRQVVGQAAQPAIPTADVPAAQQQAQATDPARATGDPTQAAGVERPPVEAPLPARAGDDTVQPPLGVLPALDGLLASMKAAPGRKMIMVFSGGLPSQAVSRLDEVTVAATAAHVVVHGFGIQGIHDDLPGAPDLRALERLALSTGGSYTPLGRNVERSIDRLIPEFSACYVLGIVTEPSDGDGRRRALRVETPRRPLTVLAPSWLVPVVDVEDVVPALQFTSPAPGMAAERTAAAPATPPAAPAGRSKVDPARDAELQRVLARALDYTAGYEREYSLLVAEENYFQTTRTERRQVGSDLLLVRRPDADGWISFRDVFEVNGVPVRDRDDRLKRLFLDPSPEADAQVKAIMEDSARYNIGQLERNINVPLFPLKFLHADNVSHFTFRLDGTDNVGGVEATRIAFVETARPTIVRLERKSDVAAAGSFLIDPASGAIVGSRLSFEWDDGRSLAEFAVRYTRDAALGLWVPAEMTEMFWAGRIGAIDRVWVLDARASYSKFRRFQVKTEEQIKIK